MTDNEQGIPHDPQLSRLYQHLDFPEPSPSTDQAILQAARLAVATPRVSKARRVLHWLLQPQQLAAMASVSVLAFLGLLSLHRPLREEAVPPSIPQLQSTPAHAAETAPPATQEEAPQTHSKGHAVKSQHTEREQSANRIPPPSRTDRYSDKKLELNSAKGDSSSGMSTETADTALSPPPPQAAPAAAERKAVQQQGRTLQSPRDTAQELLEKIRTTLKENDLATAKRLLEQYRHAYPEMPVPEDIRARMEQLHPAHINASDIGP
ncbi:hypothetical protein [Chitinilyticum piscinae]|uniref:Uncharacterized protein n=1 Tax=Chitinilyticum piscinae TaxID=2866724 RepID=A0A8J7K2G6_9NEIS|nr:hypothetical protein [Chitinilyticum piscinae]MBE9610451.1 hypothetical protein [Chitinilyticum piscinae]